MIRQTDDPASRGKTGRTLLGPGWEAVETFDDLGDGEEFDSEEEEIYVTLDLGPEDDAQTFQTETQYQLIGLDTPTPLLKLGNTIYQGEVTPLIGDEVILGLIRNHNDPHRPSHPPLYTTHHRITCRPITLEPRNPPQLAQAKKAPTKRGTARSSVPASAEPELSRATEELSVQNEEGEDRDEARLSAGTPPVDLALGATPEAGPSRRVTTTGAKKLGRPKGAASRPKIVIRTAADFKAFDPSSVDENVQIEITPDAQVSLGFTDVLPAGFVARNYHKSEILQIQNGWPLTGRGSKGGPGIRSKAKVKGKGKATDDMLDDLGMEDVTMLLGKEQAEEILGGLRSGEWGGSEDQIQGTGAAGEGEGSGRGGSGAMQGARRGDEGGEEADGGRRREGEEREGARKGKANPTDLAGVRYSRRKKDDGGPTGGPPIGISLAVGGVSKPPRKTRARGKGTVVAAPAKSVGQDAMQVEGREGVEGQKVGDRAEDVVERASEDVAEDMEVDA